jgi:hypothetical protein
VVHVFRSFAFRPDERAKDPAPALRAALTRFVAAAQAMQREMAAGRLVMRED